MGALLRLAGYPDHVVAAGVLHDLLEGTDTDERELESRFGRGVSALVSAVSDDSSIEDEEARKEALRKQASIGPPEAAAVFAADKISKAREMRLWLSCGSARDELVDRKLHHYEASLSTAEPALGSDHTLVEQLRFELETLALLPPGEGTGAYEAAFSG